MQVKWKNKYISVSRVFWQFTPPTPPKAGIRAMSNLTHHVWWKSKAIGESTEESNKEDQRSRKSDRWERLEELAYLIEGKENLRGNMTSFLTYRRWPGRESTVLFFSTRDRKKVLSLDRSRGYQGKLPNSRDSEALIILPRGAVESPSSQVFKSRLQSSLLGMGRGQGKWSPEWPPSLRATS